MFAAIWDHRHPVCGILLVVAALTMLFGDFPGDWKYLQMALFISVWTLGLLLFWGVIGTHPIAARARGNLAQNPFPSTTASAITAPEPVSPQLFRYGASRWRRGAAVTIGVALGLGMIALGVGLGMVLPSPSGWVGPIFGTAIAVWGIVLCDYVRRYLHVGIRVDNDGIKAQLYYRSTAIRWDEVVSLIKGDCVAPMAFAGMPVLLNAGTLYWVYSKDAKIWFSNSLVDGDVLSRIIAQRTGLTWEQL